MTMPSSHTGTQTEQQPKDETRRIYGRRSARNPATKFLKKEREKNRPRETEKLRVYEETKRDQELQRPRAQATKRAAKRQAKRGEESECHVEHVYI